MTTTDYILHNISYRTFSCWYASSTGECWRLRGDRGYDADQSGTLFKPTHPALQPEWQFRTEPLRYEKRGYRRRGRMEIMFDRLEDWCQVATSVSCCPDVFFSAVASDATVIF